MQKQKSKQAISLTSSSMNKNKLKLHPPPITLTPLQSNLIDPEIEEFIQRLSTAKLTINTNAPTLTTEYHTNNIQMSPSNIDHEIFEYNQYYNENDLFGKDSNGNVIIGALKSPTASHKNHIKSNSLSQSLTNEDYSEIFAFPDTANNTNNKSIETLTECKESDDNFYNNNITTLLKENKNKITENIRKRRKRKHTSNSSSLSSIDLPEPKQSSLELKIEEEKFDEIRQKYIADMVHQMFSDDEDYNGDSDELTDYKYNERQTQETHDNFDGSVLELDTAKILKGIKKKKSVVAIHKPAQLCLQTSVTYDKLIEKKCDKYKYNKMEQDLIECKKQYIELNIQYRNVLKRNDKLNSDIKNIQDALHKSEHQCMLLLLNAKDTEQLMQQNNSLQDEVKRYKTRVDSINDQITWIHTKYKLKNKMVCIHNDISESDEDENESETDDESEDMFAGMNKHETNSTMIFNEDSLADIHSNDSDSDSNNSLSGLIGIGSGNKCLLDDMKSRSYDDIDIEIEDDYKFVNECRNMFKDGNILGATMNIELIETCHRSVTMFYEIKGKFIDFVKQSENIQILFDKLQKCQDMNVNSKICEYDEVYKLWVEFIGNAKGNIKSIENMKKEPLDYTFYDGIDDDCYSDIEYDFDDESNKSIKENNEEEYEEEYNENDMHYDFEFMMDVN